MTLINPPSYLHNVGTHTAQTDRLAINSLLANQSGSLTPIGGVRDLNDMKVTANGTNMNLTVSAGQALIPVATANNGCYVASNDGNVTVPIGASHATLSRIDLVIVRVRDSFFSGANNDSVYEVVQGTAASSPSVPTTTGSYLVLAQIAIGPSVSSLNSGNVTDRRTTYAVQGGLVKAASSGVYPASPTEGTTVWNQATDRMDVWDGTGWKYVAGDDTGWVVHPVGTSWTQGSTGTGPFAYRRRGNRVTIRGSVVRNVSVLGSGDNVLVTPLPTDIRPPLSQSVLARPGNAAAFIIVTFLSTGFLTIASVQSGMTSNTLHFDNTEWYTD